MHQRTEKDLDLSEPSVQQRRLAVVIVLVLSPISWGSQHLLAQEPDYEYLFEVGSEEIRLFSPVSVAVDRDNNIIVGDSGNQRVRAFDSEGYFLQGIYSERSPTTLLQIPLLYDPGVPSGEELLVVIDRAGRVISAYPTFSTPRQPPFVECPSFLALHHFRWVVHTPGTGRKRCLALPLAEKDATSSRLRL